MTGNPDVASFDEHAASFAAAAASYERGRPSYPPQALDWLLPPGAQHVLDLGAGTGKLTRQLTARGLDVVAVEPLEGMRDELSRVLPGTTVLAGTAEHIPLPDGAVDAVLAAQAWHWVTPEQAAPEVARVLRPGGTLGLVWNERDDTVPWVGELNGIVNDLGRRLQAEAMREGNNSDQPRVGPPFGPLELRQVRWVHDTTKPELVDMIASRSYVILLPADRRAALLAAVRQLLDTHPALAGRASVPLPYITWCWRTTIRPAEGLRC